MNSCHFIIRQFLLSCCFSAIAFTGWCQDSADQQLIDVAALLDSAANHDQSEYSTQPFDLELVREAIQLTDSLGEDGLQLLAWLRLTLLLQRANQHADALETLDGIEKSGLVKTSKDSLKINRGRYSSYLSLKMGEQALGLIPTLVRLQPDASDNLEQLMLREVWGALGLDEQLMHSQKEELDQLLADGDSLGARTAINNFALYQYRNGLLDSAFVSWSRALDLIDDVGVEDKVAKELRAVIISNMGMIFYEKEDYRSAIQYIQADFDVYAHEANHSLISSKLAMATSYSHLGMHDSALHWLNNVRPVVPKDITVPIYQDFVEARITILQNMGRDAEALTLFQNLTHVRDSVETSIRNQRAEATSFLFAVEQHKKEAKEALLKAHEQDLLAQSAKRERNQALMFGGAALLFLVLAVIAYIRQRRAKKEIALKSSVIQNQKVMLEKAVDTKQLLLNELHHRVKNNLQVISGLLHLEVGNTDDPKAIQALTNSQQRVRAMGIIHDSLYQKDDIDKLDLNKYLGNLVRDLKTSFEGNEKVDLELDLETTVISLKRAIPLGLIVNEIVTNAFKYAFADQGGKLGMSLKNLSESRCELRVWDDGPGIPETVREGSLGHKIIRLLAKQVKGELTAHNDNGAHYSIVFQKSKS